MFDVKKGKTSSYPSEEKKYRIKIISNDLILIHYGNQALLFFHFS